MKEFLCQWWPLLALILLGLLTSILWDIERKKDVATSLGRLPDDPSDVIDRLEYKGRKYVKMWPSGACFTEAFYNYMRPNNKKIDMNPDKIFIPQHNIEAGTIQELDELIVEGSVEYIRKDALLKWAKDELKLSKDVECVSEKSYEEGRQQVAQNLINKLNEL